MILSSSICFITNIFNNAVGLKQKYIFYLRRIKWQDTTVNFVRINKKDNSNKNSIKSSNKKSQNKRKFNKNLQIHKLEIINQIYFLDKEGAKALNMWRQNKCQFTAYNRRSDAIAYFH